MAAQTLTETLKDALSLPQAAHLFNPVPHVATLHRWATKGTRGVKLRTWLAGGKRVTTPAAIERFLLDLNSDREPDAAESTAEQARRAAEAGKALEALGC
jgi:hypothetical protein